MQLAHRYTKSTPKLQTHLRKKKNYKYFLLMNGRHQLYGHLPPITKTIQVRRTRHAGHCWRSRDELIRDVLLWIPTHGRAKAGRPARTYIQQLCEDTGCCPEDLPRAMNDREEWRERVRDIRATSAIWWWWYTFFLSWSEDTFQWSSYSLRLCVYICIQLYIYIYISWYIHEYIVDHTQGWPEDSLFNSYYIEM